LQCGRHLENLSTRSERFGTGRVPG
jgi:hypothetical protein